MGKVTVVIQTNELSSSELEAQVHQLLNDANALDEIPGSPTEIFVVPADEEYPDLS